MTAGKRRTDARSKASLAGPYYTCGHLADRGQIRGRCRLLSRKM